MDDEQKTLSDANEDKKGRSVNELCQQKCETLAGELTEEKERRERDQSSHQTKIDEYKKVIDENCEKIRIQKAEIDELREKSTAAFNSQAELTDSVTKLNETIRSKYENILIMFLIVLALGQTRPDRFWSFYVLFK
jgi:hypothetical protein